MQKGIHHNLVDMKYNLQLHHKDHPHRVKYNYHTLPILQHRYKKELLVVANQLNIDIQYYMYNMQYYNHLNKNNVRLLMLVNYFYKLYIHQSRDSKKGRALLARIDLYRKYNVYRMYLTRSKNLYHTYRYIVHVSHLDL